MLRLPKKIGPFTLMRKLGSDGITETYAGILDEPAGKQVVVRRISPNLLVDQANRAAMEARIRDLKAIRHPTLVPVLDLVRDGDERYVVEEWNDAVDLRAVLDHCEDTGQELPHNVYLNLATQVCNGLEALHGRPGSASGAENVLHMALRPEAVFLTSSGKLLVGNYGLTPSPTALPSSSISGAHPARMEYLSPEQTQPDQSLTPASDIFSLGSILYELLTLEPLFKAESNLQTIHRVRRAEVTAQLLKIKEIMPGLDKVLYRALSLNPRHRYQRAFVLREDLRGLMAGYSFSNITDETTSFLAPLFEAKGRGAAATGRQEEPGFDDTASILRHSLAQSGKDPDSLNEAPEDTIPEPEPEPQDTGAFVARARGETIEPVEGDMEDSVTQPRPEAGRSTENTTWEQAGPPPRSEQGEDNDEGHTSWVPIRRQDTDERPTDVEDERPTDVGPSPFAQAEGASSADDDHKLARSVPPPPQRQPDAAPEPSAEPTYDADEGSPSKRGGNLPLIVGGGVLAAVLALLVCGGVVGGGVLGTGAWFGTQAGDATQADATQAPTPASEPAVADAAPEPTDEAQGEAGAPDPAPEPATEPAPRTAAAPTPSPAPRPEPATITRPEPRPEPVVSRPAPSPEPTRITRPAPRPIAPAPSPEPAAASLAPSLGSDDLEVDLGDLDQYSDKAYRGDLSEAEREALETVDASDPDYTRAQVLLYQDAKVRDDFSARQRYLRNVMSQPENQYNPQFLAEQAEIAIRQEDWSTALEQANLAERHWARLPSDLIFSRKAMIYEIQASAHQGLFYESGGEDLDSLYQAIRSWEKYQRHVQTRSREDLTVRAEDQLAKLYDMKRRLEQP